MDLATCKGLRAEVAPDMDLLERCIENAEHAREVAREVLRIYAGISETLRGQIGRRLEALRILEEYADTLEPVRGQIVKLRLLDGLEWKEIAEAAGHSPNYTQVIYRTEVQNIPPDVLQRFIELWPRKIEEAEL